MGDEDGEDEVDQADELYATRKESAIQIEKLADRIRSALMMNAFQISAQKKDTNSCLPL